jgi:hypothetical protein
MSDVSTAAKLVAALVSAVAVLAVGAIVPPLVLGDGTGGHWGEREGSYAGFVLLYDLDLKEWPFPIDPTVARRVERLEVSPGPEGRCPPVEGLGAGVVDAGVPFPRGDYSADVVHYGPFFVPTGKNAFFCDGATTVRFLEPAPGSPLSGPFGFVLLGWVLLCLVAVPALPPALLASGAWLWRRGGGRPERLVGLAALSEGAALGLATLAYLAYVARSYF